MTGREECRLALAIGNLGNRVKEKMIYGSKRCFFDNREDRALTNSRDW